LNRYDYVVHNIEAAAFNSEAEIKTGYKSPLLCHIAKAAVNAPMMRSAHTIHTSWGTRWNVKRSMVTGLLKANAQAAQAGISRVRPSRIPNKIALIR
jgi:hypothetical protein